MSTFEIIAAVFLGIVVFGLNVVLMYGSFVARQERHWIPAIVFLVTGFVLMVAFWVTIINRVFG